MALKISGSAIATDGGVFTRYSLVGILATSVHYGLLWVLVEFVGLKAGPAAAVGATFGAMTAYAGNHRYAFMSSVPHRVGLARFLLVAAGGAIASGLIVWAGTERLHMHYLMAQVIATALILWTGFALNRRWTFA